MKRNRLYAIATILAAVGQASAQTSPAAAATPAARESLPTDAPLVRVQAAVDAWFAKAKPPGATVAFLTDDGRAGAVAVGVSRKDPATPMKPTDRMMSGSIGKTWVSAVMLQLVQEGKADLDAPLSTWLGDRAWFPRIPNHKDITLRQLMNHTSGIREHVTAPDFLAALKEHPDKTWTPEELAAFCLDKDPLFPAGEGWSYADTNYILVGMAIEKITGRTYHQELRDRILTPRGFVDTYAVESAVVPGLISGYTTPGKPFPVPAEVCVDGRFAVNPQFEWTGGGIVTTTTDLARWARMLYAGDVLKPETRAELLDGKEAKTGPSDKYGLGVQIWPTRHGEAIGHSGYFPGYIAIMAWYPDKKIAVAAQINTDVGGGKMGLRRLLDDVVAAAAGP